MIAPANVTAWLGRTFVVFVTLGEKRGPWSDALRINLSYLGTLKIAIRLPPELIVPNSVAAKTRFRPFVAASRQPRRPVIRSPFAAFLPLVVIAPAISPPSLSRSDWQPSGGRNRTCVCSPCGKSFRAVPPAY